ARLAVIVGPARPTRDHVGGAVVGGVRVAPLALGDERLRRLLRLGRGERADEPGPSDDRLVFDDVLDRPVCRGHGSRLSGPVPLPIPAPTALRRTGRLRAGLPEAFSWPVAGVWG